jgi:hypothetical protein
MHRYDVSLLDVLNRGVVSVSTSRSRDGVETYPRSHLGLVSDNFGQRLGLGLAHVVRGPRLRLKIMPRSCCQYWPMLRYGHLRAYIMLLLMDIN